MCPKEAKDINVKTFNMIINKNESKAMTGDMIVNWCDVIHVIVNANSIVQYAIQIKNGVIKHVNVNVKITIHEKRLWLES